MTTIRQQARHAGLLYFVMGLIAPLGLLYAPGKLIVRGDATATAANIRAFEMLLRAAAASELAHQVVGIFLTIALYRLFRGVNKPLAQVLVILGTLVSTPIMFANVLNEMAALYLAKGGAALAAFDQGHLDALAYLFMRLHGDGIEVASIFWGLWLFPFGLLVIRSGFVPRALGWLLFAAGAGYLVDAAAWCLLPGTARAIGGVTSIVEIGELPIIFWLLIWGARGALASAPLPAAEAGA